MSPTKNQHINFRTTERQAEILPRAATATESTLTDVVLDSAIDRAERIPADRRWFSVSQEQWDAFVELIDAPLPLTAKFRALQRRPDVFTDDE